MARSRRLLIATSVAAVLSMLVLQSGVAEAAGVAQSSLPTAVPSARTPQVVDGAVQALARSGTRIIASGTFTQVADVGANGGTMFNQAYVFAFSDATGAFDRGFRPTVNGVVNSVLAGPNNTVYIGGNFTTVNGTAIRNLAQLSLTNGQLTAFRPAALNGAVNDLLIAGTRLLVGGIFTTAGGVTHGGLASLNPTTGALDPYMGVDVLGHHNWDGTTNTAHGSTGVENFSLGGNGSRLVVIGNFTSADGFARDQVMIVNLGTTAAVDANWATDAFTPGCYTRSFDYYVRALQFSPDGSYFVISTTGGSNPGTHCDTVTRWETAGSGSNVQPTWTAYTGGDSAFSVEVTGTAVYMGGHSRWLNNPNGNDSAGSGAVPRAGLAALDPRTGMVMAWNPGRNPRGVGAQALLATPGGLYVGSDTDYIGDRQYLRRKLAYFPLAGGAPPAAETTRALPANVVMAGRQAAAGTTGVDAVVERYVNGTSVGSDAPVNNGAFAWGQARGGFAVGDNVYYGYPNSAAGNAYYLYRRTFDGTSFGSPTVLDPYNDPSWSNVSAGTRNGVTTYYRGVVPDLYGTPLSTVTGAFFQNGRLYYTRSGSAALYMRPFSVDSGVVGATETTVATSGFGDVAGMFLSGSDLYWASAATGELRRGTFADGTSDGSSTQAAPGPGAGGSDWRTRVMFLGPGGPTGNTAPTASFVQSCPTLTCTFDGTGSSDPGGSIASYSWNWGDGTPAGTGATATHSYATAGTRTVTLTVTDNGGLTGTTSHPVTAPSTAATIGYRGSAGASGNNVTSSSVTVPASVQAGDGMVLVSSVSSSAVTVTDPAGWHLEATVSTGNLVTRVYSKVATAADSGSQVTVTTSAAVKSTVQVTAYSGTSTVDPVGSLVSQAQGATTSHTTQTTTAPSGSWVVSVWSDKQAVARTWSPPASGVAARSNLTGAANGGIATLLVDSGGPVPGGTVGGLTATVPTASNQAAVFTVVLVAG